jgi:hypothetical protein
MATAIVAASAAISACAGSSTVSYSLPERGESLQKIAILPVVIAVSPEDPASCMDVCSPERDRAEMVLAVNSYLSDQLGYDTLCLDFACRRIPGSPFSDEQLKAWSKEIAAWSSDHDGAPQLPPKLEDIGKEIGGAFDADGIVLLHGEIRYVQNADLAHWAATLTFSMYFNLMRGNTAKIGAEIYSVADGRKLWASDNTILNVGTNNSMEPIKSSKDRYGETIFGELPHSIAAK